MYEIAYKMSCNRTFHIHFILENILSKKVHKQSITVNRKTNPLVSQNTTAVDIQAKKADLQNTHLLYKKSFPQYEKAAPLPLESIPENNKCTLSRDSESNLTNIRPSKDSDWHILKMKQTKSELISPMIENG